ncbi:putative Glycosyltransferase family 9 protein [Candidatus Magnetomoraceae bacterium gMMP-1]
MRILIVSALGIGNTLLSEPMVRYLQKKMPYAELFLLTGVPGTEEILTRSCNFSKSWRIPVREVQTKNITLRSMICFFKVLCELRKLKVDISITTIPSNRTVWNLIAFFVGARIRITHKYPNKRPFTLFSLQNYKVPIKQNIHDIQQNLRLLEPLGIKMPLEKQQMRLILSQEELDFASSYMAQKKFDNPSIKCIALHIGCDPDAPRRWPVKRYAQLIERLSLHKHFKFIIIAGPAEIDISQQLASKLSHIKYPPIVARTQTMFQAAAILKLCHLLISNDSGIMHTGASVGVPVLAIFGPSDNIRMAPYQDQKNVVSAKISCSPCTTTLKNIGEAFSCSYSTQLCWENLSPDFVYERAINHLN